MDAYDSQTWTLGYDAADHLRTAASTLGPQDLYAPDAAGNLIHVSRPTGKLVIPPNALNQAASVNGTAYVYDADGELVQDASRKYAWDADGRLVGIGYVANPATVTSLRYDGLGRRVAIGTTTGGITAETQYGWCGDVLCQARTGADAPLRRYLAEGEATPSENAYDYYGVDQLGSVRDVLDATSGAHVAHYDYEWYGVRLGRVTASATDFRYAGLLLEPLSGLYLSATRAYDPNVGRWLSRDPIGETGGVNVYAYADGNVVDEIDPDGKQGLEFFLGYIAIGRDAHNTFNDYIQTTFPKTYRYNSTNNGQFKSLRPDFTNVTQTPNPIFELKPYTQEGLGRSQINAYLKAAGGSAVAGNASDIFRAQLAISLTSTGLFSSTAYTYTPSSVQGLILYSYSNQKGTLQQAIDSVLQSLGLESSPATACR